MAYTKQTWANLPSKTTPINASRLDHIEQGIYDAADAADTANTAISNLGTAASKDSTNIVDAGSEDLVESGAVYNALDTAFSNVVPKYSLDSSQWDDVPTNNSNKPVTSDGVYDGLNNIVTEVAEMGAKNIIPYPYGTRQKVANDGTISSNSGYYLSDYVPIGKIKRFTISFSDHGTVSFKVAKYDSSKTFIELSTFSDGDTMSLANTVAYVRFNFEDDGTNYLSYAMACYSNNLNDMSYEPYAMTNKQITDVLMNMDTTPTKDSTKPVISGGVYTALQSKADNSVIAPVEDGDKYSTSYSAYKVFIRGGKLCRTKIAVTSADTPTLNTNYVEEPDVASDLDIIESTASLIENELGITLDGTVKYIKKYGKLVQVYCRFNSATAQTVSALTSIINTGYPSLIDGTKLNVITRAAPYAPATFSAHVTPQGTIALPRDTVLGAQGYDIYGMFLTK